MDCVSAMHASISGAENIKFISQPLKASGEWVALRITLLPVQTREAEVLLSRVAPFSNLQAWAEG